MKKKLTVLVLTGALACTMALPAMAAAAQKKDDEDDPQQVVIVPHVCHLTCHSLRHSMCAPGGREPVRRKIRKIFCKTPLQRRITAL